MAKNAESQENTQEKRKILRKEKCSGHLVSWNSTKTAFKKWNKYKTARTKEAREEARGDECRAWQHLERRKQKRDVATKVEVSSSCGLCSMGCKWMTSAFLSEVEEWSLWGWSSPSKRSGKGQGVCREVTSLRMMQIVTGIYEIWHHSWDIM